MEKEIEEELNQFNNYDEIFENEKRYYIFNKKMEDSCLDPLPNFTETRNVKFFN
jgi:hypothetical protein